MSYNDHPSVRKAIHLEMVPILRRKMPCQFLLDDPCNVIDSLQMHKYGQRFTLTGSNIA